VAGDTQMRSVLADADFMRRVLDRPTFGRWLSGFLPGIPTKPGSVWLEPAMVTDRSDPKLAHIDGLNLSRAWMLEGIAHGLGPRGAGGLFGAGRGKGEFLAGDGGGVHKTAFGDGEHGHAGLIIAVGGGIRRRTAGLRGGAIGTDAGGRAGRDSYGAGAGGKFEFPGLELIEGVLILEENDLAIGLAAGLKADAQLGHGGVADQSVMYIDMALASGAADHEAAFADGGEYGIGVALVEEYGAFAGMLEQVNGVRVFAGVGHAGSQQEGGGQSQE